MKTETLVITLGVCLTLSVYLFVSAPPRLAERGTMGMLIPVESLFEMLEAENDAVRKLWTDEMVTKGKLVGLFFKENWLEAGVDAGPLPALFLRETATFLEKDPVPLSLFLGSMYPINPANRFQGEQAKKFEILKQHLQPQKFFARDIGVYSAMFPDLAVTQGCVDCHNKHPKTMKADWVLNDVMGATTWSYPKQKVTVEELGASLRALREGFRFAYQKYLTKVNQFTLKPQIGEGWPGDGYRIPSEEVFMKKIEMVNSGKSYDHLLRLLATSQKQKNKSLTKAE